MNHPLSSITSWHILGGQANRHRYASAGPPAADRGWQRWRPRSDGYLSATISTRLATHHLSPVPLRPVPWHHPRRPL